MGLGSSKNKDARIYGDIYLETDMPSYLPGAVITGMIHLNLVKDYPGNKVILKVKGFESTRFIDFEHTIPIEFKDRKIITRQSLEVYDFASPFIQKGQYSFPFSLELPKDLPGSFFQSVERVFGQIHYYLKASLLPSNQKKIPKLVFKRDLTIREPIKADMEPFSDFKTLTVSGFCGVGGGTILVKAYFGKKAYYPGETIKIFYEIDNSNNSISVKNVILTLRQQLILRTRHHYKKNQYIIKTCVLPGVKKKMALVGPNMTRVSLTLPSPQHIKNAIIFEKGSEAKKKELGVLNPSCTGTLVESTYHLELKCVLSTLNRWVTVPKIAIPVQIYQSDPINDYKVTPPVGWAPKLLVSSKMTKSTSCGISSKQILTG